MAHSHRPPKMNTAKRKLCGISTEVDRLLHVPPGKGKTGFMNGGHFMCVAYKTGGKVVPLYTPWWAWWCDRWGDRHWLLNIKHILHHTDTVYPYDVSFWSRNLSSNTNHDNLYFSSLPWWHLYCGGLPNCFTLTVNPLTGRCSCCEAVDPMAYCLNRTVLARPHWQSNIIIYIDHVTSYPYYCN